MNHATKLPLLLIAGALAACSDLKADLGEGVELEQSELVPTVFTLRWSTATPTVGFVEVLQDGELVATTPDDTPSARSHEVAVLGLKAGGSYELRAVSLSADGERREEEPVAVDLEPPPEDLPSLTLSEVDEARMAPGGFLLTSVILPDGTWSVILDRDGDYVWYWDVEEGVSAPSARFGSDDKSIYFIQTDAMGLSDVAGLTRVALDGSAATFTRTVLGHHDALVLPDGTLSWLSFDFRTASVDGEDRTVVGDTILELPEGSEDTVLPFASFVLLDQEDPYAHCEHFYEELFSTGALDFSHANSLTWDAEREAYRMMARNLDALMIIDRASGEILHQVGGDHADIRTADPEDMWSHAHMSQAWDGGFMVFDNGDHRDPQRSRVSEYALDLDAGTLELVWSWEDPDGLFSAFFGDAQKLDQTWLATWSTSGRMEEVADDGEVVWRLETEVGAAFGRTTWVQSLYAPSGAQGE